MIVSAAARGDLAVIDALIKADPFACRVTALFDTYPPTLPFADYWTQRDGDVVTAAIARSGGSLILCLTDASDLAEIASFITMVGAESVLCRDVVLPIRRSSRAGVILTRKTPFSETIDARFIQPDMREAYALLQDCASEGFLPPPFEDFYVDVSHKLRHGCARVIGAAVDGGLAAMAMTVAESKDSAVIGAVACSPNLRRRGYGAAVVKQLTNNLLSEGRIVFLQRAANENESFYDRLGFAECGSWREYR